MRAYDLLFVDGCCFSFVHLRFVVGVLQVLLQRGVGGVSPGGSPSVAARVLPAGADEGGGEGAERGVLQDRHTRLPGSVRGRRRGVTLE